MDGLSIKSSLRHVRNLFLLVLPLVFPIMLSAQTQLTPSSQTAMNSSMLPGFVAKGASIFQKSSESRVTTILPTLQNGLDKFLDKQGMPIAAAVVLHVETGDVLALVQGKDPKLWGVKNHTALYSGFPAASLFKVVSSIAALETKVLEASQIIDFTGGCQHVESQGLWLAKPRTKRVSKMSLSRAFALSCNRFYARLVVKHLGLGLLTHFARKLGWEKKLPTDFEYHPSPLSPPPVQRVGIQAVGKFAAGFGKVGMNAVHAAWLNLVIANKGQSKSIQLYMPAVEVQSLKAQPKLFSEDTAEQLKSMMRQTVIGGTATSAFRRSPYRQIKRRVSGKTGTLSGIDPKGSTTWFAGLMSYEKPEIAVAAVVVNQEKWSIKGMHLAAEACRLWDHVRRGRGQMMSNKIDKQKLNKF